MKLPYVAQQVGNAYFYRLTEIKELSGSLWWMREGRNLLKPIAGCGLFSHVDMTGVARHLNLGFRAWSRIRVISFRYHGFPYSTVGPQHWCYKGSLLYQLFHFHPLAICAVGYCPALRGSSFCLSICPACVTTLQPTIFCLYFTQSLALVGAWTLWIMGSLCSFCRILWYFEILRIHWLTGVWGLSLTQPLLPLYSPQYEMNLDHISDSHYP